MSLRRQVEKTRAQQFSAELADGLEHLRSAAVVAAEGAAGAVAPRVDIAREALAPRVGAARDALSPRMDAAMGAVTPRVDAARQAASRSWDTTVHAVAPVVTAAADSARRATDEARKQAGTAAKKGRKHAGTAVKKGRKARKEASSRAQGAARAVRGEAPKRHRKWPWVVGALALGVAAGTIGAVVSRRSTPQWEEYETEHQFAGDTREAFEQRRDSPDDGTDTPRHRAMHVADSAAENARPPADDLPSDTGPLIRGTGSETDESALDELGNAKSNGTRGPKKV